LFASLISRSGIEIRSIDSWPHKPSKTT